MILVIIYIAAIITANLLVAWLGPWFSPINALVFIGLDLSLRDTLHERWQGRTFWPRMTGMIAVACVISYLLNPASGKIGLASLVAFGAAAIVDTLVYQLLITRGWFVKANVSNVAGAAVDSLIFPTLAFGGFMLPIVLLQFTAKVGGGAAWAWVIAKSRK